MRVAIDVTPLEGAVTGVGQALKGLLAALPAAEPGIDVARWTLTRASLPLPPAVLVQLWARLDRPGGDRWLPEAEVVHGTNYVVPPTKRAATVTVHDCWCARHPSACSAAAVASFGAARRAVRRGAWVHVLTERGAADVRELCGAGERVAVVPWGVPPVPESGASPVDGPYVLAVGTLSPRKGFDTLVRAVADAGLRLVLAGGDGSGTPAVDAAIARTGADVVRVMSPDEATAAALFRGARVLAYPSRDEGFGFPPLQAMSVDVPVVTTRCGVEEVVGDAALVVDVDDADGLAEALTAAHDDDETRAALIHAGRERAASYTWERTAHGLADLWRAAVAGR